MNVDFKNTAENLIIILIATFLGGFIGYTASTHSNKQTVELLRPTIEEAIRKETTHITNEFATTIKKLKATDGATANVKLNPSIESSILKPADTLFKNDLKPQKRKGFFKRIFNNNKP